MTIYESGSITRRPSIATVIPKVSPNPGMIFFEVLLSICTFYNLFTFLLIYLIKYAAISEMLLRDLIPSSEIIDCHHFKICRELLRMLL